MNRNIQLTDSILEVLIPTDTLKLINEDLENNFFNDDVSIEEGSNYDMTKVFFEGKKKYREEYKNFKASCKAHDYSKARENIYNMDEILVNIESDIKDIPHDKLGVVFGDLAYIVCTISEAVLPMVNALMFKKLVGAIVYKVSKGEIDMSQRSYFDRILDALGITPILKLIKIANLAIKTALKSIKDMKKAQEEYKNAKTDEDKLKCANMYRVTLTNALNKNRTTLENLRTMVDTLEEAWEKKQAKKAEKENK